MVVGSEKGVLVLVVKAIITAVDGVGKSKSIYSHPGAFSDGLCGRNHTVEQVLYM